MKPSVRKAFYCRIQGDGRRPFFKVVLLCAWYGKFSGITSGLSSKRTCEKYNWRISFTTSGLVLQNFMALGLYKFVSRQEFVSCFFCFFSKHLSNTVYVGRRWSLISPVKPILVVTISSLIFSLSLTSNRPRSSSDRGRLIGESG